MMKQILKKLFFGKPEYNTRLRYTTYQTHIIHLIRIWNNTKHNDIGFEKLLRLFLVAVQFIFPGLHYRNFFGKMGVVKRNVAIEFYVLFKTFLPLFFLITGLYHHKAVIFVSVYLMSETIFYVTSLIFVSDMFVKPRSYRRNILMLFLNYIEICLSFAVIYGGFHLLGNTPHTVVDYIYFSIVTASTIGYGDLHPVNDTGKIIVCIQAILVLAFIVLFLNFFGSKVEVLHKEEE
jgi:hypothetical protein